MKIECAKNKLEEFVNITSSVLSKNLDLDVLSCLKLNSENNSLKIQATNIDSSVEVTLPAKTGKDGTVFVSGEVLQKTISSLKDDQSVVIDKVEENLSVVSKNNSILINCVNGDDFPSFSFDDQESENNFSIKIKDLKDSLKAVFFSAASSNIKPELSSVYFKKQEGDLFFVTTDGYRLSEKKIFLKKEDGKGDLGPVLIPIKSVISLIKILEYYKNQEEEVIVYLDQNQMYLRTVEENLKFSTRLVDGNFPDYNQFLPKDKKTSVICLKKDLNDLIKVLNIFSDEYNQIDLSIENKRFVVNSNNKNIGKTENILDSVIEGEEVSLSFNHKYINEALNSINTDSIEMCFFGENKPMLIKTVPEGDFKYLVMSINK